jgi:hypothetical protein
VRYLIQFKRFRRGVPVVVRTIGLHSDDATAALARAKSFVGTRNWPVRADSLRVLDDGGRTLIDWPVPVIVPRSSDVAPAKEQQAPPRDHRYSVPADPNATTSTAEARAAENASTR